MKVLVTGCSGHLGEALMRMLATDGYDLVGLDVLNSPYTSVVGSIIDRSCVRECVKGVGAIVHTATLHKPHLGTHRRQDFVDTNVTGTLNLLEQATKVSVGFKVLVVVRRRFFDCEALSQRRGWRLLPSIERVYSNERARRELDWSPRYDFQRALDHLLAGEDPRSPWRLPWARRATTPPPRGSTPCADPNLWVEMGMNRL